LVGQSKNTTKFGKGNPGKPKGAVNKTTKALREMILLALSEAGGVDYLVRQAKKKNPAPFMALLGKVLPMQVTGDHKAPVQIVLNGSDVHG
jgi:hypothetical protein